MAIDEEAPLTEWALNMVISIPAAAMVSFSHLAIVEDDTGLCGLINEMNSWEESPLNGLVLPKYSSREETGHSLGFS